MEQPSLSREDRLVASVIACDQLRVDELRQLIREEIQKILAAPSDWMIERRERQRVGRERGWDLDAATFHRWVELGTKPFPQDEELLRKANERRQASLPHTPATA